MLKKLCEIQPKPQIQFLYANKFGGRLKTINIKK
jgi:hypothetical protein